MNSQIVEATANMVSAPLLPAGDRDGEGKPRIVIFRDHLLYFSETFVLSQAEALQHFVPYYAGSRIVGGISSPKERTLVINNGGLRGKAEEALFKIFGLASRLGAKLRNLNPKLIHAHFGSGGALALPLSQSLNVPLVVMFHGSDAMASDSHSRNSYYSQRLYVRRRGSLQKKGQLFLAVSGVVRQKLLDKGFPADRTHVHHIGIDLDFFKADPRIAREPIVLFVGRLVRNKGAEYFLEAAARMKAMGHSVKLVVVGDGPLRGELQGFCHQQNLQCSFVGSQPACEVRSWMNRASVFCVPSVTLESGLSEGFGLVFAEAHAMGLPVVSFATGGISEAVQNGTTGFLGPERDSEFLAEHIMTLLKDHNVWLRFSDAGLARARVLFDLKSQTAKLEGFYRQAIRDHASRKAVLNLSRCNREL